MALLLVGVPGLGAATALRAQGKPTLTPADYGKFESVGLPRLAPDGSWMTAPLTRVDEENALLVRGGARDTTLRLPYATSPQFTPNSQWLLYLVAVSTAERERLQRERKPIRTSFAARHLASGRTIALNEIAAYALSADGSHLALSGYPAEGKKTAELTVLRLDGDVRLSFGSVAEYVWSSEGARLAFAVNPDGTPSGSLMLFDGRVGAARVLASGEGRYRALAWRAKAADLAALRTISSNVFVDTAHTVLTWRGVDTASAPLIFDAGTAASNVPPNVRIAESRRPLWSADGRTLFLGVQPRVDTASAPKKLRDKPSDVEIWHTSDVRVIPHQRSTEGEDARRTRLLAWTVGDASARLLTRSAEEVAAILPGDQWVTETDRTPYAWGQKFGRPDADLWRIDVRTGERTKLLTRVRYQLPADPSGRRVAWFDGRDYWVVQLADGERRNLTATLTRSARDRFVNRDDDHPTDVLPPVPGTQWSSDGAQLIVGDGVDLWAVPVESGAPSRLTNGRAENVQHRVLSFAPFSATPQERAVDLTQPVYLSLFGRTTKRSGFARLTGTTVERLAYGDAMLDGLTRADSAPRFAYRRQRADESPNVFGASAAFTDARALTATNGFMRDVAWGRTELLAFRSSIGVPLQAILHYPANCDPSKRYPLVVYTYERLTQDLHRFTVPSERSNYNATVFTQNGYFVLMPDIVFRPREPGLGTLYAVEPAVRAVIARGLVDPARVGHMGHSQGGYEAAYLATHSRLFATTVMGSGISDMISFAGQMHWGSIPEFDHWETGQFRMQVPPWEDFGAMLRNSPLNRAHVMQAKSMLIEIGSEDPTVDMRQGVLLYNYLRRAGKTAVLLNYPGEGHGLSKKENAIDYSRRIQQWFAYWLKGEPAASWITDGQSWLTRKALLDANK
ncbi:prolyl oligopeptidase family serine peptidase [Gemmatimonas sp.]